MGLFGSRFAPQKDGRTLPHDGVLRETRGRSQMKPQRWCFLIPGSLENKFATNTSSAFSLVGILVHTSSLKQKTPPFGELDSDHSSKLLHFGVGDTVAI